MSCLLLQIVILLKKILAKIETIKALKLFKYLKLLNLTYFMF